MKSDQNGNPGFPEFPTKKQSGGVVCYSSSPESDDLELISLNLGNLRAWRQKLKEKEAQQEERLIEHAERGKELENELEETRGEIIHTDRLIQGIEREVDRHGRKTGNPEFKTRSRKAWANWGKIILIMALAAIALTAIVAFIKFFILPLP